MRKRPRKSLMSQTLKIEDAEIEVLRLGAGPPIVLLESEEQLERDLPFVAELAKSHDIIIPSPIGFGRSNRPDWVTNMDDISYLYLDMLRLLNISKATLVGFSLGGWIAAEMATKNDTHFKNLILVDPYGVKHGGPTDSDIADIWVLPQAEVTRRKWCDPANGKRDFASMPEEQLYIIARNTETFAKYCWNPYMHNPKLKKRLHGITIPAHLIWGAQDGIVDVAYGEKYRAAIPGATMTIIPEAAHLPHIERPDAFLRDLRNHI